MGELLKAVRTEVTGRLSGLLQQDSLQVNQYLKLSFQDRGQAVGRDQRSKVIKLPPQTNLREVFERQEVGRRLLILGEPGAGKTTSLLKLAAELLTQAAAAQTNPIPVIFELSTWKNERQSIEQWLVEQLKDNYSIDFQISQSWLEQNRILPLLDGLDELGLTRQRLAIAKINQYLQQDIARKLVVCCRWEEYKQGEVQLYCLNGAYYLQPPTETDIKDYLQRLNQQELWQKISVNDQMRELAQKPLFLNLMMTAFQGEAIVSEAKLFTNYVAEQLKCPLNRQKYPPGKPPYSDQDTKKYLTYLAGQLEADSLTVFLIEKMQPYWLNTGRERWTFRLIFGGGIGLIFGSNIGLISGLISGLIFESNIGLNIGSNFGLISGLISGLIFGLFYWEFKEYKITAEAFEFSWQGLIRGLIAGLIRGLIDGLISGLIGGGVAGLIGVLNLGLIGLNLGLMFGGIFGLVGGGVAGLIVGLIRELNVEIQSREKPNQGIKESLKKTLIILLISSSFLMLILPLIFSHTDVHSVVHLDWITFVITALGLGLIVSVTTGGQDLIQHLTLRLILWQQGLIPRNYAHFLDYVEERKLIHRIGGQYRFLHDSLRKYFASQAPIPKRIIQYNLAYRDYFGLFLLYAWIIYF